MSRSDTPPTNKKAVLCPDCDQWVTLQGYGGHRRFYHGEYQKRLEERLFNQLIGLRKAGKISQSTFEALVPIVGGHANPTMKELQELQDAIDILRNS